MPSSACRRPNAATSAYGVAASGESTSMQPPTRRPPNSAEPPLRWAAGDDVVEGVEDKARLLLAQVDAHRELSTSLAHDDARVVA